MQSSFAGSGKLSREEYRRQKDLDAARKAGTAPAEVGEDGQVINPHVPDYMSKAPWYLDTGKRSLKHQQKPDKGEKFVGIDEWYDRKGQQSSAAATKYRKGACDNCGAMTHKTRECLERPRKKGARWTNKDIAADEAVTDFNGKTIDFAAKRDRWNGYDPAEHRKVMDEYEAVEEERRKMREEAIDKQGTSTGEAESSSSKAVKKKSKSKKKKAGSDAGRGDSDFSSSDEDDEAVDEKYAESANMAGQKVDTDNRMSIRNLRIREDRAKYLYNLDPNSAYYDPKTRSMREAPGGGSGGSGLGGFAGDNAHRNKGDSVAMQRLQLFAWQAEARGNDLHLQANPTVNERQFREFQEKKEKLRESTRGSILDRYGGAEHFDSVPKELREGQTENYVEYSRSGRVIKGQERAKVKSRFEEDVLDNNHTAIWGSWYDMSSGQWGYKCCCSTIANSYCTGEAGIEAAKAANALRPAAASASASTSAIAADKAKGTIEAAGTKRRRRTRTPSSRASDSSSDFSSSSSSSEDDEDDRRRSRKSRSRRRKHSRSRSRSPRSSAKGFKSQKSLGEGDVDDRLDKTKLKRALEEEDRRLRRQRETSEERRRREEAKPDWLKEAEAINAAKGGGAGVTGTGEVTEEEMEAYRLKRQNAYEDPMANYRDEGGAGS